MSNSRIPADKSSGFAAWALPEVKRGQVVQAEKLKHRGPRGELLGVASDEVVYSSITAAQLEEISQAAYDDVRASAHKDGYEQGHQEGYQAGLAAAEIVVEQRLQALQYVIEQLMSFLGDRDDEVEQALVNLSICVASGILRRELTIDSSHILEVVHEALQTLPVNVDNLTIFLSDQDYQQLSEHRDVPEQWRLKVDRDLSPGGCRVTTDSSVVDFTLEDQFQQMVNNLVEKRFAQLSKHKTSGPEAED